MSNLLINRLPSRMISGSNPSVALMKVIMPLPSYRRPKTYQRMSSFVVSAFGLLSQGYSKVYLMKRRVSLAKPCLRRFEIIVHDMGCCCKGFRSNSPHQETQTTAHPSSLSLLKERSVIHWPAFSKGSWVQF